MLEVVIVFPLSFDSVSSKSHVGGRLGIGISDNVDQRGLAALDGALNRGPDRIGLGDEFAVAAERLDHLVVTLEAKVAPDIAASLARGEASVVRDNHHDRQLMANRGVHLHSVPSECAVAAQHQHWEVGARNFGTNSKWDADAHAPVRTSIETASRLING